jgi:hypothetical protein
LIRRWLVRLLALAALAGVGYGVYTIVREGTRSSDSDRGAVQPALRRLAKAQEQLGSRLEALLPGWPAGPVGSALRDAQRAHERAVRAFRRQQDAEEPIPDEERLDVALGEEFDYLDALRSVLVNPRSPLLREVGDRAQRAKDAFTEVPDSEGVEDGIRGTQAFLDWARAR